MSHRELTAWINGDIVGNLSEHNDVWAFQYDPKWLENSRRYALAPALPLSSQLLQDGSSRRPVQWYFDNLLPEEEQRRLLARDAHVPVVDQFGLLQAYGAESAGSLVLTPTKRPPDVSAERLPLSNAQLNERIAQLPKQALTHGASKRMSLAGAQHKLAVILDGDELFEPVGAMPSTHILKPDHPSTDYPHSVINEWFVMRLAQLLSLNVPAVYRRYVPAPVYLIDRFDRQVVDKECLRLHAIDGCQLLGLAATYKYNAGSVTRLNELAEACVSSAVARVQLFDWLVFNVLVGNTDAHLKNLSFMVYPDGVQLAPFYDLLCTAVYESPVFAPHLNSSWQSLASLAWPIARDTHRFADINHSVLLDTGVEMGLSPQIASKRIQRLTTKIVGAAQNLYDDTVIHNKRLVDSQPSLGITFEGELRCLRAIQFTVIGEMARQLTP